jgi:hypothetical protein
MKISSKLVGAGLAAFGAMSLCAISESAVAGSISQPGELVGYSWNPLPEGIFFATTGSYGNARGAAYNTEEGVNVPVIIWSTPWTIFGARVETYAAVPSEVVGVRGGLGFGQVTPGAYRGAIYNPYANVGLAWNLGNGFGVSSFVGGYAPVNNSLAQDFWTFNWRTGVTWTGDGWNLSGHVILGITGNNLNTGSGFAFPGSTYGFKTSPNYVNVDLSATKTWGKLSFGPVAFGSWDIGGTNFIPGTTPITGYVKQSQFAVGGLVGYDFGPVILQTYLTHDVASSGYISGAAPIGPAAFALTTGGHTTYETRFWMRVVVPLWVAPAPAAPVVAKY